MMEQLDTFTYAHLVKAYPYVEDFFTTRELAIPDNEECLKDYLKKASDEAFIDKGLMKEEILPELASFLLAMESLSCTSKINTLTIQGGCSKKGEVEAVESLTIRVGEIISVVGPTGSGKSRLLEDIECLAQKDTPTNRQILIDGNTPGNSVRFSMDKKLVAQISQNMNFVMDCNAFDFVMMHSESRMVANPEGVTKEILVLANELAGEPFSKDTALTNLSGGQSRALMIADTALLSQSPIVLIDEIENAGVDRKKALDLLVKNEKIVFLATHDPLLALMANRRIIINGGSMIKVLETNEQEKTILTKLEEADAFLTQAREQLRQGDVLH
ncbi:MAG: ATP-binding cassette domain-containing protein [Sphaerochaetaceae bacterium]